MVGPYKLPAGVVVFPCLHTVMNYSGNWEDPQTVSAACPLFSLVGEGGITASETGSVF